VPRGKREEMILGWEIAMTTSVWPGAAWKECLLEEVVRECWEGWISAATTNGRRGRRWVNVGLAKLNCKVGYTMGSEQGQIQRH
jgi:hypothetical protein